MRFLVQTEGQTPGVISVIREPAPSATVWGVELSATALDASIDLTPVGSLGADRVILRSGSLRTVDEDGEPIGFRTWGTQGWSELEQALVGPIAEAALRTGVRHVSIAAHVGDVVSDARSCERFLELQKGWRTQALAYGLVVDPAAMIDASMIGAAADHMERVIEKLAPMDGVDAVRISNVAVVDGRARSTPIGSGVVDPKQIARMAQEYIPASTYVIVQGADRL